MNAPSGRTYLINGFALLGFLALTVAAAYINLGPLNTIVALLISAAKAALIILFFMHIRYSKPLVWVCAGAGFFWLGIMLVLAMSDYLSRGWR
ncbi:MAG TPA: cytochrome C oxidase subunit IV family protein [Chthoniobacterales bacterium]